MKTNTNSRIVDMFSFSENIKEKGWFVIMKTRSIIEWELLEKSKLR